MSPMMQFPRSWIISTGHCALLQFGFHIGDEARLKTQGYGGHPMKVHVHRRQSGQVAAWLRDAGFTPSKRTYSLTQMTPPSKGQSSSHAASPRALQVRHSRMRRLS